MRFTSLLESRHFTTFDGGESAAERDTDKPDVVPPAQVAASSTFPWRRVLYLICVFSLCAVLARQCMSSLNMGDFSAYYCAGKAVLAQRDPYTIESLHDCENTVTGVLHANLFPGQTIPAPLPPYTLAVFALLALMPAPYAVAVWFGIGVLSYAAIVVVLQRRTEFAWETIVAATAIPLVTISLPLGQLGVPIMACMLLAAHCYRSGSVVRTTVFSALTMCCPSIGLPFCVALAFVSRAARHPLLTAALLLALVNVIVLPWRTSLEYLSVVLPAHALAELMQDHQYSLTHLVGLLGVPGRIATAMGQLEYFAMLGIGVMLAYRLARTPRLRDLALLSAPVAVMFGGAFVHIQEMSCALAVVLIACREAPLRSEGQAVLVVMLLLLTLPLQDLTNLGDYIAALGVTGLLLARMLNVPLKTLGIILPAMLIALQSVPMLLATRVSVIVPDDVLARNLQKAVREGRSLEETWGLYVNLHSAWQGWVGVLLHTPVEVSLGLLLLMLYGMAGGNIAELRRRIPKFNSPLMLVSKARMVQQEDTTP